MVTSVWRSKKQNSFRFWYIYTCLIVHLHRWKSLSYRGGVLSVQPSLDLLCQLLPVPLSCCLSVCLSVGGARVEAQVSRWAGEDSRLAMYTFMVGPWLWHTAALFPQVQDTHLPEDRGDMLGQGDRDREWGADRGQKKGARGQKKQQTLRPTGTYWSIWSTGPHFVSCSVPADLKDAPSSSVTVNQRSGLQKHRKTRREHTFHLTGHVASSSTWATQPGVPHLLLTPSG